MSQEDAAAVLGEFIYHIDNLPAEVAFLLGEIAHKDERVHGEWTALLLLPFPFSAWLAQSARISITLFGRASSSSRNFSAVGERG